MRNEKTGDYVLKKMAERSAVRQPQKAPKTPTFVDTDLDDSDDDQEPAEFAYIDPSTFLVKHPQKASKTSGAHNEDPQKTS